MAASKNEQFDYNLIRYLIAIVDAGSMSSASEVLSVAPSAISYAVKKMRDHYNDPLFIRTLNGVIPSALAMNLYNKFKSINNDIVDALNVEQVSKTSKRKIYIRAEPLTELWITHRLTLSGILPDECIVEFKYSNIDAEQRCLKLRNREIDLDLGLAIPGDASIRAQTILDFEYALICREQHKTIGKSITWEQFIHEDYVAMSTRVYGTHMMNDITEALSSRTQEPLIRSECSTNLLLTLLTRDSIFIVPQIYAEFAISLLPLKEVKCDFLPRSSLKLVAHFHKHNIGDEMLGKIISALDVNALPETEGLCAQSREIDSPDFVLKISDN